MPGVINLVNMANGEPANHAAPSISAERATNPVDGAQASSPLSKLNPVSSAMTPNAPESTYAANQPNAVNTANKSNAGEGVYSSVSDPARRGSEAATGQKDWTVRRPKAEKVEDPPPVPMSKLLMDHVKHMWAAGASAIQVQQVQNLQEPVPQTQNPLANPGVLAKEVFTYTPSKIKKTEDI